MARLSKKFARRPSPHRTVQGSPGPEPWAALVPPDWLSRSTRLPSTDPLPFGAGERPPSGYWLEPAALTWDQLGLSRAPVGFSEPETTDELPPPSTLSLPAPIPAPLNTTTERVEPWFCTESTDCGGPTLTYMPRSNEIEETPPAAPDSAPLSLHSEWIEERAAGFGAEYDAVHDPFRGTRYRGIKRIGGGGMGEVFSVMHRELGSLFVAKLLRAELQRDARAVDRVRIEAETLSRLEHPNIVTATAFGHTANNRPFVVMELLKGLNLAERLKRGPVSIDRALSWMRATLSALRAAHELGIVHRDVKPQNLFLHEQGNGRIVLKVLDFGVARVLPNAPVTAPIPLALPTLAGMVLGTPRFVSPEGAAGQPVDIRGDIYAVGLVLYLLLAGRGPFDDVRRLGDVLDAQVSSIPEPPSFFASRVLPSELDRVVLKALRKEPGERFQSAADFDRALSRIQEQLRVRPSAYRPRPATSEARGWGERPREVRPRRRPTPTPDGLPVARSAVIRSDSNLAASVSSGAKAVRPLPLFSRPVPIFFTFWGTLILMAFVGASSATLLGRVVGGIP